MFPHAKDTVARIVAAAVTLTLAAAGCNGSVGAKQVDPGNDAGTQMDTPGSKDSIDPIDAPANDNDASHPVDAPAPSDAAAAPPAMLRMVFPISGVTTAATVTARGTTDGKNVAAVAVNGAAATSTDGFLTWKASVALASGDNTITAVLTRSDQSQVQVSAAVARVAADSAIKRGKLLSVTLNLMGGSIDSKGTAMYLADANADGVLRIDVATGDQSWATCSEHSNPCGGGPSNGVPFTQPMDVAVDDARQRAFVVDGQNVFAVDLSGKGGPTERTVISGPDVTDSTYTPPTYAGKGTGTQAQQFGSMGYDPAANVIYAVDWGSGNNAPVGFFKIDPETGNRQVLSTIGQGGVFRQVDVSAAKGALYSTAAYQSSVTIVSLANGTRSGGPSISEPQALAASDALGALFAVDKGGMIVAFEGSPLASRPVAHVGGGPGFSVGGDLIFIYDGALGGVAAFDPQTGERIVVSR
jgi:hypothetical protein